MAPQDEKKRPAALNLAPVRSASTDSSSSENSLKHPRAPRFAEVVETREIPRQAQLADVGFGYINDQRESVVVPMTPKSPLKSAMKVPGTARTLNPMSPTFREEDNLEKKEAVTDKEQARDLRIKTRVRMAKFALRGVNFSCSLIVLSMLGTTFVIFDATKSLPSQNNLPPWASNTSAWPQKVVLGAACVSLAISIGVFIGYCRGGHKRAEKVGVYYTLFAVGYFIFSAIMWAVAAGILQFSKNNSNNQDIWGWSCVQNRRSQLFSQKINYALVCELQSWGLLCAIIEIVIELLSIALYCIVFYRYYSKRRLHKTMDMRDKARSDLYLAQLRTQSAPNTPGFGPKSPGFGGMKSPAFSQYAMSPRFPPQTYRSLGDIEEGASPFTPGGKRLIEPESAFAKAAASPTEKPFKLQAPPMKAPSATPRQGSFSPTTTTPPPPVPTIKINEHGPIAPGEQQYEAVPIPGAYAGAVLKSPPPSQSTFGASISRR